VPPTTARRISTRLLTSLQTYDPQVLSVEFDALFKPTAPMTASHREWAE